MTPAMQDTTDLYEAAGALEIDRVCVDHETFRTFSLAVSELRGRLGDEAGDSYWRPVLARLRRLRWELATVPLPFNHPALALEDSATFVSDRLRDCEHVFPAHSDAVHEIAALLSDLSTCEDDPLGAAVRDLVAYRENDLLLIRDVRHAAAVEESLTRPAGLALLTPPQFADTPVYAATAAVGPACWFPRQVFAAPRAGHIDLIHFRWLRDPPVDPCIFAGGRMVTRRSGPFLRAYGGTTGGANLDSAELLPLTDWAAIASGTGATTNCAKERPDTVEAYLLLLASQQAVYLEAEEGSRAYITDLGSSKELYMETTRSIQPGMYLVNRLGGEGDYIPAIADSLLGQEAPRLRTVQRRWKEQLREQIDALGMQDVLSRLDSAGSPRPTRANLRRWVSLSSICTEDFADFAALMEVIDLRAKTEEIWRDMKLIDQAHRRAGKRVRKLLEREILKGDIRDLEVRGYQDYDVEEIEGEGALRVARVEARHPETLLAPVRRTRQLLSVERDLWQG